MRLNETYQFSPAVLRALHHYDSALRVRWGRQERCVRVERRVRRGRDVNPATCRAHFDDYEAARDGYACVYKLHPGQEHALLARLVADDLWRRGGAGRVADDMDRATLDREARARLRLGDFTEAWARELWREINTVKTAPEGAGRRPWRGNGRGQSLS